MDLLAVGVFVRVLGEVGVEPDVEPSASAAVADMSRRLTENGEHGARAIRTIEAARGRGSDDRGLALREDLSSSWHTDTGGSPPSSPTGSSNLA